MIDDNLLKKLIFHAKKAASRAYAPYSQFHVGAALITKEQAIISGCNVENASYGLTMCAERNCIAQAINQGKTSVVCMVIYTEQERLTPPCGACRQVLSEFLPPSGQIIATNHLNQQKMWTIEALLPDTFTPKHLSG